MNPLKFIIITLLLILEFSTVLAAKISEHSKVVVMNFGTLNNSQIIGLNLIDLEKPLYDYIVNCLSDDKRLNIIELPEDKLKAENINTVGLINPKDAKRLGEILDVQYIIYGKLLNVTADETDFKILENGVSVHAVRAKVIIRMVDTKSGIVIGAVTGEGQSKSSLVKASAEIVTVTIGTKTVTQDSVTQSLKKAVDNGISELLTSLFDKKK